MTFISRINTFRVICEFLNVVRTLNLQCNELANNSKSAHIHFQTFSSVCELLAWRVMSFVTILYLDHRSVTKSSIAVIWNC